MIWTKILSGKRIFRFLSKTNNLKSICWGRAGQGTILRFVLKQIIGNKNIHERIVQKKILRFVLKRMIGKSIIWTIVEQRKRITLVLKGIVWINILWDRVGQEKTNLKRMIWTSTLWERVGQRNAFRFVFLKRKCNKNKNWQRAGQRNIFKCFLSWISWNNMFRQSIGHCKQNRTRGNIQILPKTGNLKKKTIWGRTRQGNILFFHETNHLNNNAYSGKGGTGTSSHFV